MPQTQSLPTAAAQFDAQVETLIAQGFAERAGLTASEFARQLQPLRAKVQVASLLDAPDANGRLPFVVVPGANLLSPGTAIASVDLRGRSGFTTLDAADIERFTPIPEVEIPPGPAYLLVDVDSGRDSLNVTPDDALVTIRRAGRSPLTLEEGVAVLLQDADILRRNNCFSLLGSRCGDRRVMALWVSQRRPRLGWCWAGNPHTWLGSASCAARWGL